MVGTPGTVLDWILKRRAMDPSKIVLFVLDEADIMIATQGHQDQTIRIHKWVGRALSRADLPSPPPPLPSPPLPPLTGPQQDHQPQLPEGSVLCHL